MIIANRAFAGTLESSDVFVEVLPLKGRVKIQVESVVYEQFGKSLKKTVQNVLRQLNVTEVSVLLKDRGALDYAVRARVETALRRAGIEG
jgi:citrate lyase subunit gamma (acyl carrier protein)